MSLQPIQHRRAGARAVALGAVAALILAGRISADDELVVSEPAEGSVAPYVPTVEEDVELMLDVAGVGAGDYVIDLGSGDGRIAIAAAGRGAFAHGVEIEPELVDAARRNAVDAGVADRVSFVVGDIFDAHIADASVVSLYLFPEANIALRPKLLADLTPGTRVVSNSFDMGDWLPDVHDTSARSSGGILLWIVPANVEGQWTIEIAAAAAGAGENGPATLERYSLRVAQANQEIGLTFTPIGEDRPTSRASIEDVTLRGDRIAFRVAGAERSHAFAGRVDGDSMSGYVQIGEEDGTRLRLWHAVRVR